MEFNTGAEFKFFLGLQPSNTILKFGGTITYFSAYEGKGRIEWHSSEAPTILERLREIERENAYTSFPFEDFEKSADGVIEIRSYLASSNLYAKTDILYEYMMGCIIYHQLSWMTYLNAEFEF